MEKVIKHLIEWRQDEINDFVSNSIYKHQAKPDSPVPDTTHNLEMIIELNLAISILKDFGSAKVNK